MTSSGCSSQLDILIHEMGLLACPSFSSLLAPQLSWLPPFLQEEAEALVELQSRLQEAQDTTEALQVQVGCEPRGWEG